MLVRMVKNAASHHPRKNVRKRLNLPLMAHVHRKVMQSSEMNRLDRYIQVKHRGLNAGKIQKEHIKSCSENSNSFL